MKTIIPFAFLLASLCSLCLCGESFALDPETKTPYQLKVVLHFADNRLLTDVFRDRVERELHDGLQASFGDLVNVEVTREHPRLNDVLKNGLKSLDGWKERSSVKTHFVLIDYAGVYYEIQSRQFDGLISQPSPVVRRDRTRDRDFVAKAAALLIEQDFGLLGTFGKWPGAVIDTPGEDSRVTVELKGAGLGVPLDRWIKAGDVFAAVQMPLIEAAPGKPVRGALLMVDAPPTGAAAACVCRVFRRYATPRDSDGVGYRCVKLGTVSAPLRLRLFQALPDFGSGPLKDAVTVQIRHHGFDKEDVGKIVTSTKNNDDSVDTSKQKDGVFDNVAFVSVFSAGDKPQARIPVPLFDDQPVPLSVNVASDAGSLLAFRQAAWERAVNSAWQEQNELFRELTVLASKPEKRAESLKQIQEGLQRSRDDFNRLTTERAELVKAGPLNLPAADDRLKKINEGINELKDFLAKLEKIDVEENDPKKKQWLAQVEQGRRLEADLEVDKALAVYDQVLKDGYEDENFKKHLTALHKEWMTKNEEHRKARAFIYEVWPTLDDVGLKDKLSDIKTYEATCKAAGDWRTLTKLFKATEAHAVRMKQELSELKPEINIDDEKQAKVIQEVSKGLVELARDVSEYLKTAAPGGK
jgi:hypothetical protein